MSSNCKDPVQISVIVPVRNRNDLLAQLLDALDHQTRSDFEVIVIDDGSTDGAGEVALGRLVAGRPVTVLDSGGAGAVAARTLGAQASSGEILAFTDSDCMPTPAWLEEGAEAIEAGADLVNGLTVPARPMRPFERSLASGEEGLYPTANMFFLRRSFEEAGGFDRAADRRLGFRHNERARGTGFGEDTMLAWKMIREGYKVRYVPEAVVEHHVFPADFVEWLSRGWQTAAFPALVAEVPELRGTIMRSRFLFGARSRAPFYATLLAIGSGRRAMVWLGLAWWASRRVRDMRAQPGKWQSKLPYLPAEMLLDAVMGTGMIIGSMRSRTLVL